MDCLCFVVCLFHDMVTFVAYEKAVREQRLRTEISQARKSTEFYLRQADKAKQIQAMEARKQLKAAKTEVGSYLYMALMLCLRGGKMAHAFISCRRYRPLCQRLRRPRPKRARQDEHFDSESPLTRMCLFLESCCIVINIHLHSYNVVP